MASSLFSAITPSTVPVSSDGRIPGNDLPQSDYQSINQSNFYSANILGEARLSGATAESVFNSKIEETVP